MPFIIWNENYSVDIAEIDQDHKKLVEMMNDLHAAMQQQKEEAVLRDILTGLVAYTATHFKKEEEYFKLFGYPEADSHKQSHADFIKQINQFEIEFNSGGMDLAFEVMNFLRSWLLDHIVDADKNYAQLFHEHGLK